MLICKLVKGEDGAEGIAKEQVGEKGFIVFSFTLPSKTSQPCPALPVFPAPVLATAPTFVSKADQNPSARARAWTLAMLHRCLHVAGHNGRGLEG